MVNNFFSLLLSKKSFHFIITYDRNLLNVLKWVCNYIHQSLRDISLSGVWSDKPAFIPTDHLLMWLGSSLLHFSVYPLFCIFRVWNMICNEEVSFFWSCLFVLHASCIQTGFLSLHLRNIFCDIIKIFLYYLNEIFILVYLEYVGFVIVFDIFCSYIQKLSSILTGSSNTSLLSSYLHVWHIQ